MSLRPITNNVWWCGAVDWDRKTFDALIPLPEGTSYNSYLVKGTEKTALLDGVDDTMLSMLLENLKDVASVDYIIAHHAEQDHSGTLPHLLARYPQAKILTSPAGKKMLMDLLPLPDASLVTVKDGETVSLGGKTLRFLSTPWVHWPETMCTFLEEDQILFSCDFFGSHLATSDLFPRDETRALRAAKLYYAQIMMPYAKQVAKNIEKVAALSPRIIAPSHGPLFSNISLVIDAWKEWTGAPPKKEAVIAFVSMHHSTRKMADRLTDTLSNQGIAIERFDLTTADLGQLAVALVDASVLLLGSPAVLNGIHPLAAHAAYLVNALKPKLRFAGLFGSYGWGSKVFENPASLLPDLQLELLPPVLCKGLPREADFQALDAMANAVAQKMSAGIEVK